MGTSTVDLRMLGRNLPDLYGYRNALARSTVSKGTTYNLPSHQHLFATPAGYQCDRRGYFQRPYSAMQQRFDDETFGELTKVNLRPHTASLKRTVEEAQEIIKKYEIRTRSGSWMDLRTRGSFRSQSHSTPHPQDNFVNKSAFKRNGPLFPAPARRSCLSIQTNKKSKTEVEIRAEAMKILERVGLGNAYKSHTENAQQAEAQRKQVVHSVLSRENSTYFLPEDEFREVKIPKTPLASSQFDSIQKFREQTSPSWRHPLPKDVGAEFCDNEVRERIWNWLTEPDSIPQFDYLMKLCD